jgi:diguanylate cyclase (GGDEF)-like protein/PAS domain S-box-containing protein
VDPVRNEPSQETAQEHDTVWVALRALLNDPQARVSAISDVGFLLPLPDRLAELTGVPNPQRRILVGKTALDGVVPGDRAAVIEAWDAANRTGAASVVVRLVEDPDGGAWVLHMMDARPSCGCFLAVSVPTSDRAVDLERETASAPARPRLARVVKDQIAVIVEVDEALPLLLGWAPEDLIGHRSSDFVHPDDQELAVASWIEMLAAPGLGRRVRLRHACKDGTWAWFELTNHNLLEERGHVLCEVVDISEEMAAHEALRAREQLLDRLAESLPVGVVQTAADGRVVYANSQASSLFGPNIDCIDTLVAALPAGDADRVRACFTTVLGGAAGGETEAALPGRDKVTHLSVVVRRLDEGSVTTGAVACFNDVTDSLELRRQLQERARIDPLTGSYNRTAVLEVLEAALGRPGRGVAAVFIDLDGFKQINDTLGHQSGDELLCRVAEVLRGSCRDHDAVGRLGGDEYLVACLDVHSAEAARRVAQRFADALRRAAGPAGSTGIAASLGVAWTRPLVTTAPQLIAAADAAMYTAKKTGDGLAVLAPPVTAVPAPRSPRRPRSRR